MYRIFIYVLCIGTLLSAGCFYIFLEKLSVVEQNCLNKFPLIFRGTDTSEYETRTQKRR